MTMIKCSVIENTLIIPRYGNYSMLFLEYMSIIKKKFKFHCTMTKNYIKIHFDSIPNGDIVDFYTYIINNI